MDDIVERLREVKRGTSDVRMVAGRAKLVTPYGNMMNEAADVIESLRSDISRLTNERDGRFEHAIGDEVEKVSGYRWPGVVVSRFMTMGGQPRYVVECTVPEVAGALHIYAPSQIAAIRQKSDVPTASALSADATCDKLAASNTGGSDEPALLASTTAFAEPHSDGGGSADRSRPAGETIGHPGPVHGGRTGTHNTSAYPGIRNSDSILSLLPSADVPTDVNDMPEGGSET